MAGGMSRRTADMHKTNSLCFPSYVDHNFKTVFFVCPTPMISRRQKLEKGLCGDGLCLTEGLAVMHR